jgi:Na+-transporting methylmalonyl-CoA/oxaloacetate decarboxylase gamma subunit
MNIDWNVIFNGLQVAGLGLAGVFAVLIMFFIITKLMVYFGNKLEKKDSSQS